MREGGYCDANSRGRKPMGRDTWISFGLAVSVAVAFGSSCAGR